MKRKSHHIILIHGAVEFLKASLSMFLCQLRFSKWAWFSPLFASPESIVGGGVRSHTKVAVILCDLLCHLPECTDGILTSLVQSTCFFLHFRLAFGGSRSQAPGENRGNRACTRCKWERSSGEHSVTLSPSLRGTNIAPPRDLLPPSLLWRDRLAPLLVFPSQTIQAIINLVLESAPDYSEGDAFFYRLLPFCLTFSLYFTSSTQSHSPPHPT